MSHTNLTSELDSLIKQAGVALGELINIAGQQHLAKPEAPEWSEVYFRGSEVASYLTLIQSTLKSHSHSLYAANVSISSTQQEYDPGRYKQHRLPAGPVVYVDSNAQSPDKASAYYCPHCHHKRTVSMLQPGKEIEGHRSLHCPECHNDFKCEAIPDRIMFTQGKPRGGY